MTSESQHNSARPRKRWVGPAIKWLWVCFIIFIVLVGVFFVMVYNGVIGYMPPIEELKNPQDKFASIIYTADGEELGRYSAIPATAYMLISTKFRLMLSTPSSLLKTRVSTTMPVSMSRPLRVRL